MAEILKKINDVRQKKIEIQGFTFGHVIPPTRKVPLVVPDFENGIVICEIKRGSPSAGVIGEIKNPVELAGNYISGGAGVISVLTEEDHFFGSLNDLMDVKNKYPNACILRKDFIQYEEEMDITYRAGADMVLLIVASYNDCDASRSHLKKLYDKAIAVGLTPLVETHNEDEINVALGIGAKVIGINTRDLKTFVIDRNKAYYLKKMLPEGVFPIYESGIRSSYEGYLAGSGGFKGILVGTSLVKDASPKKAVSELVKNYTCGLKNQRSFFQTIFTAIYSSNKPVVKICGITTVEDAEKAIHSGADIVGFVMANSKRKVNYETVETICKAIGNRACKVAVVTDFSEDAIRLVNDRVIDAIQFHGFLQTEDELQKVTYPWYQAVNMSEISDFPKESTSPFILIDAFSEEKGGSGKRIDDHLVSEVIELTGNHLCIAGGITPENVGEIIQKYKPDIIDLSSGVESEPGIKNHKRIEQLFEEIKRSKE